MEPYHDEITLKTEVCLPWQYWPLPVLFFGLVICCIGLFGASLIMKSSGPIGIRQEEQPGSVEGYIRGDIFLILRLPGTTPVQQIQVYSDGSAAHVAFSSDPTVVYKKVRLSQDNWRMLEEFRKSWCQETPRFHALQSGESHYEIALRCGPFDNRKIDVPLKQLPQELAILQEQLPQPTQ
jgi:hypothetical protein